MWTLPIVLVVCVFCLESSQAFYGHMGRGIGHNLRQPLCSTPNKPCRLRVQMRNSNGTVMETNSVQTCTCSSQFEACSSDWSQKHRQVVSREVVSTFYNITLDMMFCRDVQPKRFCNRRHSLISLEVKGSLAMPQDIASYNCKCRRRQPLVLHERRIGSDHLVYHKYVCANHKRTCNVSDPCLIIHPDRTVYNCKCGDGYRCRTDSTSHWDSSITYGFCAPRVAPGH